MKTFWSYIYTASYLHLVLCTLFPPSFVLLVLIWLQICFLSSSINFLLIIWRHVFSSLIYFEFLRKELQIGVEESRTEPKCWCLRGLSPDHWLGWWAPSASRRSRPTPTRPSHFNQGGMQLATWRRRKSHMTERWHTHWSDSQPNSLSPARPESMPSIFFIWSIQGWKYASVKHPPLLWLPVTPGAAHNQPEKKDRV